jgi:iron complex outermembrane recepter protein
MTTFVPRRLSAALLASTGLSLFAGAAHAQTTTNTATPASHPAAHRIASQANTQRAQAPSMLGATAPTDVREEQIHVTGRRTTYDGVTRTAVGGGLMVKQDAPKSVSTVTRDFIAKQAPGTNPMNLIALLPGVNSSSSDALGLSGGNMSMRGLQQTQIGYTLEGFPLNDIGSYAIYQQEIADSENLTRINVAQGSADLDSPHISATGGVVDMYMIDPKTKPGGLVDFSYGNRNTVRGFLRLDSGYIGKSNVRAYASFSDANEDPYRGSGQLKKLHGETKIVNEWGQGNRISLAIIGNQLDSQLTPSTNLQSWEKYGYGVTGKVITSQAFGNKTQVGALNGSTTNTIYNTVYTGNTAANSNYYRLHTNPFVNIYSSAPSTFTLTDHLVFTTTPYFWYGNGNGGGAYAETLTKFQYGAHTLPATLNGQTSSKSQLIYNPSNTTTYRPGDISKFVLTTGINRLELGFWFEYSKQIQTGPYSGISSDGSPLDQWGGGPQVVLSNGQTAQYRDALTQTYIRVPFIADSISLFNNKLTIDGGLKFVNAARYGHNFLPDTSTGPYINHTWNIPLPTAAIRYQIDSRNQIFASGATNMRIPTNYSLYDAGSYYSGSGYSTHGNANQKAEISISVEAGYRYTGSTLMGSVTYFHYNFTNRLFTQTIVDSSGNYYTSNLNGGGSVTDGVDVELGTRPILYHIRPYISAEYLSSHLSNNLPGGANATVDYLPTAGKFAPQTPKYMISANLDYDDGSVFIDWNLRHVGKQYSTFMDDQSIPEYTTMNLTAGYRFKDYWMLKSPFVSVNFYNLTDNKYLGFNTGVQTNARNTRGIFGNVVQGAAPTYQIAAPFSVIGTVSTGF